MFKRFIWNELVVEAGWLLTPHNPNTSVQQSLSLKGLGDFFKEMHPQFSIGLYENLATIANFRYILSRLHGSLAS